MARLKNGTPTGFKDSKGVEIKVGDKLKGPTGVGTVLGAKVHFPDGRAPALEALMKNNNDYYVVHLKPVEKPENKEGTHEPDFIPGQVVATDMGIAYFKGVTVSKTSADVICFWNKEKDTVSISWVVPLAKMRWANSEEEKAFKDRLITAGLSLDKKTMQAKKVEPVFKEGDWVATKDLFGQVKSWSPSKIILEWALDSKDVRYNVEISDCRLISEKDKLDYYRRLVLAGYTFTCDWRIMPLAHCLSNEVKDKVGSKEVTIKEVASLVHASKKEELHGELSLKLTF